VSGHLRQTHGDCENTDFLISDKFTGTRLISLRRIKSQQAMQVSRWLFTESSALQALFPAGAVTGQLVNPQSLCTLLLYVTLVALETQEQNTDVHTHRPKVLHSLPSPCTPDGVATTYSGKTTQANKQLQEPHTYPNLGDWSVMICQINLTVRNQGV